MTDYEYIYQQIKKAHYSGWDDEELRKCVDMLPTLSRDDQLALYLRNPPHTRSLSGGYSRPQ